MKKLSTDAIGGIAMIATITLLPLTMIAMVYLHSVYPLFITLAIMYYLYSKL